MFDNNVFDVHFINLPYIHAYKFYFLGVKNQVIIFFKVYYITQNKVWNPCMYTIKHDSDVSIKIAEVHCSAHQQSDKPCTKL